jgi:signal transduction histidine kinase
MVRDEKGNPIDFRFLKVNPAYERLTTLKSEDIIGKTLLEILPNTEHHWIDTYNTVVESGTPIRFEDYSPELKKHWEIYAFRNQPNQFACVISDITDIKLAKQVWQKAYDELEKRVDERTIDLKNAIKSAEFAKKEAEKANHAKSEFISVISHELRTPMHGILSFSKFGVEKFDKLPREEIIGFFHDIRTSAVRMMSLLNDLLDLAKLESGKMNYSYETTDVEPIIQSAISELSLTAEKRKIEIELIVGRPLKPVKCDGQRIRQVLLNLLSNALKFTEPKKQITVFCEKKSADRAVQEETAVEEQISIKISDNGPGIPENNLRNIFNKFIQCGNHTSDTKGTGLGLAICKEIITAHGGEIWAENNVDGGASFCFTLPLPHK